MHTALSWQYHDRSALELRPDLPGAEFWAVALRHAMLSYFEVAPHVRFERHRHESEQITLVLDGELCFEFDDRTVTVQAGEVIAVPSMLPHAVFTRDRATRAVDAWSPVPEKYRPADEP